MSPGAGISYRSSTVAKKWDEVTVGELTRFATDWLPDGCVLEIRFDSIDVSVDLDNPDGQYQDVCQDDLQGDMTEMVQRCVNFARDKEGLPKVELLEA